MAHLSLSLLGPFQATLAGEPITGFESAKVRALLAYLAVEADRPHPREVLAGLLWPEWPDSEARSHLRHSLANLRKAIGDRQAAPPYLSITRETIQFNPASDCWVDVTEFVALAEGDQPGQWEEAATLVSGPFLQGFSIRDSAAYEEWLRLVREQIQRQALAVLHRLAEHREARGAYERAQGYAWRQLELESSHEEAHRQLMRLLALDGQRSAALAQYESCRRTLAEELGVEPGAETTALYERIRDGALEGRASRPAPSHNLPATSLPLVGREAELAEVVRLLRTPACRLLTLVGPGGIGKSRLALEAATRLLSEDQDGLCTDGVYWILLAPLHAVESLMPTVAAAVGLTFYPGAEPRRQLLGYLRRKRMLLVLDNFEHLLAGADLVSGILRSAPGVVVLVTSRIPLNLQDEHLYRIAGLELPEEGAARAQEGAPDAAAYSAVQLFLQSARRVLPGYEPTPAELAAVVRVCRLVEGTPLAILLAASWMEMLRADEVVAEIERSLDFLESDLRDLPERQHSMRAVYTHSWNLLAAGEQQVLQALSVFRGGFTRRAAEQVSGASLRQLRTLVHRSLLHRAQSPSTVLRTGGHYEMHELLRQYAAEKLEGQPKAGQAVRDRHSAFYSAALSQWGMDLQGTRQRVAETEIEADLDNIRAAWAWAAQRGQAEWLSRAIDGFCLFCMRQRRYQEAATACERAVAALERASTGDEASSSSRAVERLRARALAWQGHFCEQRGDLEAAARLNERSRTLLEGLDPKAIDCPSTADCRSEWALALFAQAQYTWQVDLEQSRRLLARSLALYRALGDRWWMSAVLCSLGGADNQLGRSLQAERWFRESLAIDRSLGDRWGAADALSLLGESLVYRGRQEEGERLLHEALAEIEGTRGWGGDIRLDSARYFGGRFAEARSDFEREAALYDDLGLQVRLVEATEKLIWCDAMLGRYEQAQVLVQANLARCVQAGYRLWSGWALMQAGAVALARREPAEARRQLAEGVRIFRSTAQVVGLINALLFLACADHELGRPLEAERHLCEAIQMALEGTLWHQLTVALPGVALLLADKGSVERAIEVYSLALCHPYVANSRWFEDVAGKHIAAAVQELPPDVVAAAQERGRALDLWDTVEELLNEFRADP